MNNNENPSNAGVEFFDYHLPALSSGDFIIEATLSVEGADERVKFTESPPVFKQHFSVCGPRFSLTPQDVHAVYPPAGSVASHANVLPHVILTRSTLPWRRSAEANVVSEAPWLAVLLFDQSEIDGGKVSQSKSMKVIDLISNDQQSLYSKNDMCTVIDVDNQLLGQIAPNKEELRWLTHVRRKDSDDYAVIIGNRLPAAGKRSVVHLVSMEGLYQIDNIGLSHSVKTTRLVSLKSWQFTCDKEENSHFVNILTNLENGTLRLPVNTDAEVEGILAEGLVPLGHKIRTGQKTVSWYRGPLVPGRIPELEDRILKKKISKGDDLLRYDDVLGMLNVSYATAWELGRLLMVQSKSASVALYNWKHCCIQDKKEADCCVSHLPCVSPKRRFEFPLDWFELLMRLEFIPFNYLVPDETMLPQESIRFFQVDSNWLDSLICGAFSIGSVTQAEHHQDCCCREDQLMTLKKPVSGFLLRSEAVAGWPSLQIEGYKIIPAEGSPTSPLSPINSKLHVSKNILFCLFDELIQCVDIHLPAEVLHFGLELDAEGYKKNDKKVLMKSNFTDGTGPVVDIQGLATNLCNEQGIKSAQFASIMIERVPGVRFKVGV
jgi:hypothetical protein